MTTLYDKVKKLADEKNLSIREVEIRAGAANGTIGKWRDGKPFAETLIKVAAVLEVSVEELMA